VVDGGVSVVNWWCVLDWLCVLILIPKLLDDVFWFLFFTESM
jgi:hypothetical protein